MMKEIREGFTLIGVLRRLLVTLRGIDNSLRSLDDTAKLQLKLALLQHGASMAELLDADTETVTEGGAVDEQDDGDFAEMERIEQGLKDRGRVIDEADDLGMLRKQWLEVEETK